MQLHERPLFREPLVRTRDADPPQNTHSLIYSAVTPASEVNAFCPSPPVGGILRGRSLKKTHKNFGLAGEHPLKFDLRRGRKPPWNSHFGEGELTKIPVFFGRGRQQRPKIIGICAFYPQYRQFFFARAFGARGTLGIRWLGSARKTNPW